MSDFLNILHDISPAILDYAFELCVESIDEWRNCLVFLNVCPSWRRIGVPKLYKHAIVEYPHGMVFTTSVSNISLIMANGHQLKVKNFVLHAAVIDYLIISLDIIYGWLRTDLTELVKPDQLLLDLTFTEAEAPPSAAGVIIERLLCGFPNLRYMFFSDMNTIYGSLISKMLCYTVSGYPDIARPANAVFDSAVVHDFNRIALGVDIDETAVQTMSPGYFQWLGGIPIPYQYLRYLANQIDAVHENMGGFKQYLLYFPSLLYINSAGNITSYEMYQVLDNGMMHAEDASPYEIQDENL